ncbi:MAG: FtsW/RodA/SpoVE family cell cycle protein [Fimbriimonadaceae bacterium]|nr:FtsW/RodA/SpoVE family cell cycle protein [Fimbriimonadaceae bacterium]
MNLPPGPIEPNAADARGPSAEGPTLRDYANARTSGPSRPSPERRAPSRPSPDRPSPDRTAPERSDSTAAAIPHWRTWWTLSRFGQADLAVTLSAVAATLLGLIAIFDAGYVRSLARDQSLIPPEMRSQLTWLVPSCLAYLVARLVPIAAFRRAAIGLFAFSIVSLFLVEIFGESQNEAKRWIAVGGQKIQPSEFAKVALILYVAQMLAWKPTAPESRPARTFNDWIHEHIVPFIRRVGPFVPAFFAMMLVERGSDLGTAGVLLAITLVMFLTARIRLKSWLIGGTAVLLVVGILVMAQPYRMERIRHHQARWSVDNVNDIGYQTTQSERGMADGGLLGVGVGNGHVKHIIPATTNDFVMATIAEETGLLGASIVILILGVLAVRLALLLRAAGNPFARYVIAGVSAWVAVQACVNIMMANGTLPAIGIPLPFVSSGGSSLVALWAALGLAQSAALTAVAKRPVAEERIETRDHRRWDGRAHLPGA